MAVRETATNKTFYSIVAGKIRKQVPEGTEGAIERENKNGKKVCELCYDEIFGNIVSVEIKKLDFGRFISISFDDGDSLEIPFDSKEGQAFIKMMPNIDETKEVVFSVWINKEGKSAFSVKQGGNNIKWAFTKDNPNGMPSPQQKEVADEIKWDWSEVEDFLYKTLIKESERFNTSFVKPVEQINQQPQAGFDDKEQDLPF